jgi:GNAT superfamily N-acetyltransferase
MSQSRTKRLLASYLLGRSDGGIVILWEVEVLPEFRNKGIAKELISKLQYDMKFRNDRELYLFYNFDPESSLEKFYKKLGFTIGDNLKVANKTIL